MTTLRHRLNAIRPVLPWLGWALVGAVSVVLVVKVLSAQVGVSQPEPWSQWGFVDFRDTIYLPTRDLLAGHNPYDAAGYLDRHPNSQMFNLYLPQEFLLLGWLAYLPRALPVVIFTVLTAGSLAWLVEAGLRSWVPVAWRRALVPFIVLVLLVRGPGVMSVRQGQLAVVFAMLAWIALKHRGRPWLEALAAAAVLVKPQTGLVLLVLVLSLRGMAAFLRACLVTAVTALPGCVLAIRGAGGVGSWIGSLVDNLRVSGTSDMFFGGPVDIPTCLRALGVPMPTALQVVITGIVAAVVGTGVLATSRGDNRPVRFVIQQRHQVWFIALALVLVLPNQRYALAVMVPALLLTCGALLTHRAGPSELVPLVFGGYAVLRSETAEQALGAPERLTQSLTGWLVLLCLLALLPQLRRTNGCPVPRRALEPHDALMEDERP